MLQAEADSWFFNLFSSFVLVTHLLIFLTQPWWKKTSQSCSGCSQKQHFYVSHRLISLFSNRPFSRPHLSHFSYPTLLRKIQTVIWLQPETTFPFFSSVVCRIFLTYSRGIFLHFSHFSKSSFFSSRKVDFLTPPCWKILQIALLVSSHKFSVVWFSKFTFSTFCPSYSHVFSSLHLSHNSRVMGNVQNVPLATAKFHQKTLGLSDLHIISHLVIVSHQLVVWRQRWKPDFFCKWLVDRICS